MCRLLIGRARARIGRQTGSWWGRLLSPIRLFGLTIAVGILVGAAADGFRWLLPNTNRLFFGTLHTGSPELTSSTCPLHHPYILVLPAFGGLLVGLFLQFVAPEARGHGVAEILAAMETRGSRIPPQVSAYTALASSVTIGSGGSAGPSGPAIQIGAVLASGIGQWFRLTPDDLRTLLACGGATGLAALYNAPLGGTLFAAEVLLEDIQPRRLALVALSAVTGHYVASHLIVNENLFSATLSQPEWQTLPMDLGLGLTAGPLGIAFLALDARHRRTGQRAPHPSVAAAGARRAGSRRHRSVRATCSRNRRGDDPRHAARQPAAGAARYVVGWMVAHRGSAELAQRFIEETAGKQQILPGQLTLYADRGTSMTSKPVAFLLSDLGITKTHSRPHVSNDNPYSESQFKTLKYRPGFPDRFLSMEEARSFCCAFFPWYNTEHRHSGIGFLTPEAVHTGQAPALHQLRSETLAVAGALHPERFVRQTPVPPPLPTAAWINKPRQAEEVTLQLPSRSVSNSLTGSAASRPLQRASHTISAPRLWPRVARMLPALRPIGAPNSA